MARFEIVVEEVEPPTDGPQADPTSSGIPLSSILERTGGKYIWHVEPPQHLRENWRRTSVAIGDSNLADVARSATIPVSLEHLSARDPATTRVRVRFEITYATADEARAATAARANLQLP
ncbi:hypothetical protein [Cellulomonas sp. NTE-D12]|uniref:hypothetical protein n=1 Tax=Cellulomonas sp. NTE-D12 TaxID=2962632 RepID=UPI0030815A40|nr:hypothetical protein CELD12_02700 [Cellulomonas sp. NTE-D12]